MFASSVVDKEYTKQFAVVVSGYAKDGENSNDKFTTEIPTDLFDVIFDFYFVSTDSWDTKLNHHSTTLKITYDNCVLHTHNDTASLFGNHIVKPGEEYQWKIEILESEKFNAYFGIVKNNNEWIQKHLNDNKWNWGKNGYRWEVETNQFMGEKRFYSSRPSPVKKGNIIIVNVDMKSNWKKVSFKVEGGSYDHNRTTDINPAEYRLACSFSYCATGSVIKML